MQEENEEESTVSKIFKRNFALNMGHLFKLFCSRIINLLLIDECLLNQYIYIKKKTYINYISSKRSRNKRIKKTQNHYIEVKCIINKAKNTIKKNEKFK